MGDVQPPRKRTRRHGNVMRFMIIVLFSLHFTNNSKPDELIPCIRHGAKTVCCSTRSGIVDPTPSAYDDKEVLIAIVGEFCVNDAKRRAEWVFFGAVQLVSRVVPIGTPFGDVAMHIVQPERIWFVGTNHRGAS